MGEKSHHLLGVQSCRQRLSNVPSNCRFVGHVNSNLSSNVCSNTISDFRHQRENGPLILIGCSLSRKSNISAEVFTCAIHMDSYMRSLPTRGLLEARP